MDWTIIKTISNLDRDKQDKQFLMPEDLISKNSRKKTNNSDWFEYKAISLKKITTSTSASLLTESLIHLLCILLQESSELAEISYKKICTQLCSMGLIDKSFSLNEFTEMRGQYQMEIYKIICAAHDQDFPISLPLPGKRPQYVELCWSRYKREFDEIAFIAGGGFGKVFLVRHKLDCIEYAIKRIKINSTSIQLCHLAEVKTIASLNHPNIVQYKAAWLEPYIQSSDFMESSKAIEVDLNSFDSTYSELEDNSTFFSTDNKLIKYNTNKETKPLNKENQKIAILYIQMSLCQITLQNWLIERNAKENFESFYLYFFKNSNYVIHTKIVYDIFCQILTGLDYIHSKQIIHHDIKPSNIFMKFNQQEKMIIQLGDFGLACPLQDDHSGVALGTKLYAAPEQLKGECNSKSDVYSLGIVLLELLMNFKTDMERVKIIDNARNGVFPSELSKQSIQFLEKLLKNKEERPTTKEVLVIVKNLNVKKYIKSQITLKLYNNRIKKKQKNEIQLLKETNNDVNRLINNLSKKIDVLQKTLCAKNRDILELKKRLSKYEL